MAFTEFKTGTKSVDSTEWSLATDTSYDTGDAQTTKGLYALVLDLSDMIAGDQLQLQMYEKCRSGDTQRVGFYAVLTGAQSSPIWVSPAVALYNGWDWTAKTLAGTSITVLWSLRQLA